MKLMNVETNHEIPKGLDKLMCSFYFCDFFRHFHKMRGGVNSWTRKYFLRVKHPFNNGLPKSLQHVHLEYTSIKFRVAILMSISLPIIYLFCNPFQFLRCSFASQEKWFVIKSVGLTFPPLLVRDGFNE